MTPIHTSAMLRHAARTTCKNNTDSHRKQPHPSSVRDNCSFASDLSQTLRLEVSEVRLSSGRNHNASHQYTQARCYAMLQEQPVKAIQTRTANNPHPSSVRDNCSFASDLSQTLRLEVSEVRLSSGRNHNASHQYTQPRCYAMLQEQPVKAIQTRTANSHILRQSGITLLSHRI